MIERDAETPDEAQRCSQLRALCDGFGDPLRKQRGAQGIMISRAP